MSNELTEKPWTHFEYRKEILLENLHNRLLDEIGEILGRDTHLVDESIAGVYRPEFEADSDTRHEAMAVAALLAYRRLVLPEAPVAAPGCTCEKCGQPLNALIGICFYCHAPEYRSVLEARVTQARKMEQALRDTDAFALRKCPDYEGSELETKNADLLSPEAGVSTPASTWVSVKDEQGRIKVYELDFGDTNFLTEKPDQIAAWIETEISDMKGDEERNYTVTIRWMTQQELDDLPDWA